MKEERPVFLPPQQGPLRGRAQLPQVGLRIRKKQSQNITSFQDTVTQNMC